jgi:RNA polymerase sigma-70 factor (ECF subfamily)
MTGTTNATGHVADAVLVEAARRGDLFAWERLVRRYQEPVFRIAFLIVRDSSLAESAAQSTFVRAYRALPSYRDELGVMPWLFRIAAGESRQQRRASGRPRRSSRPAERSSGPRYPASAVPGLEQATALTPAEREVVGEAIDRLGEEDRLTIASRYLLGLSRSEAASALSIASALADEHLQTALRRLRTRMAHS